MAKNKVFIDVVVDDQGTTKRVAVNAKKLGLALDNTADSALTADRRMKGASQQSANGTKNFSKMAQGISGGLVPAYATLAAQVFAVSAAFQFLKSASEIRNLIAGQEALGAATGVAYKSITNSIKEATDGQLSYTEAARAAAIGTAAGLSPSQLDALGNAAKNASFALGRDLTDSFNRLVKGVTKAEPELLDELGITLRLADATEEYARALNKPVKELSQLERTQAVANDVLTQAEKKFAAIEKIMDPSAAALNKFLVSFESLINNIKQGTISALIPIFDFLSERTLSLTAALGLFALPIIKSILPSFEDWGNKAAETFDLQKEKIKELDTEYDGIRNTIKNLDADRDQALRNQQEDATKVTDQLGLKKGREDGKGAADFLTGGATSRTAQVNADRVLKNAEKQIQQHGVVITGKLKGANAKQVADLRSSYAQRVSILKGYEKKHSSTWKKATLDVKLYAVSTKKTLAGISKGAAAVSGKVARLVSGLFSLAGWVGIGLLLVDVFKQMQEALFPIDPALKALNDAASEMTEELTTLNLELAKTADVKATPGLLSLSETVIAVGNAFQSADLNNRFKELEGLKGADNFEEANTALKNTIGSLSSLSPEFAAAAANVKDFTNEAEVTPLIQLAQKFMTAGVATSSLAQNLKDVEAELLNLGKVSGAAVDPTVQLMQVLDTQSTNLGNSIDAQIVAYEEIARQAKEAKERRQDELDLIDETQKKFENTGRGTFAEGAPYKQARENVAIAKERLALTDAQIEAEKKFRKALIAQLEVFSENAMRRAQTLKVSFKLNQIQKDILKNEKQIAKEKTLGRNLEEELKNLNGNRLASTNKVLAAEGNLVRARFAVANLASSEDAVAKKRAAENLTAAEAQYEIAVDQNTLEQIKIDLMEEQARAAERVRKITLEALNAQTRLLSKKRLQDRTAAFSSDIFVAGRAAQTSRELGGQDVLNRAQAALKKQQSEEARLKAITTQGGTVGSLEQIQTAEAEVRAAREKVALATQELELIQRAGDLKVVNLERENQALAYRIKNFSLNPAEREFNEFILQAAREGITYSDEKQEQIKKEIQLRYEQQLVEENLINIANTLKSSMEAGIQGLITGTMTAKQAFLSMASAVLKAIAQMIAQMIVAQILASSLFSGFGFNFGGTAAASTPTVTSSMGTGRFRYGGMVNSYAEGGVATGKDGGYPAVLHGTEAVVPLPNNRSIPVELTGNTGGTNNITVNVNIDNEGRATRTSSNDENMEGGRLGKVIAGAVQQELLNQKRAGGILNPYGVA